MARVPRFLHLRTLNATSLQALVRELPLRALLPLVAAIFLLFTLLGPVTDMLRGAQQPRAVVIRNALVSGVVAIGYAGRRGAASRCIMCAVPEPPLTPPKAPAPAATPVDFCENCGETRQLAKIKGCIRCLRCGFKADCSGV